MRTYTKSALTVGDLRILLAENTQLPSSAYVWVMDPSDVAGRLLGPSDVAGRLLVGACVEPVRTPDEGHGEEPALCLELEQEP